MLTEHGKNLDQFNMRDLNKILVLGANGMIGNSIFNTLSKNKNFNVYGTVRKKGKSDYYLHAEKIVANLDVSKSQEFQKFLISFEPDLVINCIGITKHNEKINQELFLNVNSTFSHNLKNFADKLNFKIIHLSSDCVFSGKKGNYHEKDFPDSNEIYGVSKFLGEIISDPHLTIRTSIIGHELETSFGLLEWFLSQKRECKGFKNAYFSGVTTLFLSRTIEKIILEKPSLNGLFHLSGEKISKFDLLKLFSAYYSKKIKIIPEEDFKIDRSLDSRRIYGALKIKSLSWEDMLSDLTSQ